MAEEEEEGLNCVVEKGCFVFSLLHPSDYCLAVGVLL